ncbi:MAG: acetyl-CoA carboxylase biotin carboxyl carrier protein subunit [Bacteroidales bacterium]|nr:acetyl-CoA carboxylase biotin carboxyl carrier protein subunit [Bacteroidales bacterium]MCF8389299.1 acetyl-CoA carboxylase biotin carboxyl carrier protein subunit [Bacteroidales bacterium]
MTIDKYTDFFIEETSYRTTLNEKFKNRKNWKKIDPKIIHSVIPGTIVDIFVNNGQLLKSGDPILILEAMKMRNVVCMPMDGTLKSVQVEKGQVIPKGFVLADIE